MFTENSSPASSAAHRCQFRLSGWTLLLRRATKVRKRKDHSEKLTCFEIERDGQSYTSEMWVRDETGTLVPDVGPKAPGGIFNRSAKRYFLGFSRSRWMAKLWPM